MQKLLISLIIMLVSTVTYADLTAQNSEKRIKVRYALENGILSLYDIPFETYIKLEMWDEIEFIFRANNKNMIKHEFPGLYYSRPYMVNEKLWVFENAAGGEKTIYIFDPGTFKLLNRLNNKAYAQYDGGIRKVFGDTIISGGSDEDVDAAVIWNTATDDVKTLKLRDGHYVGAIEVKDGRIFVGSCGGVINLWNHDTLAFLGIYASSEEENVNWRIFNEKECITNIRVITNKVIGVGEKTVFIWNIGNRRLTKAYPKALPNSIVFFYETYMVEYKNDQFVIRDLESGKLINKAKAEKSIEDLIVTSERILADHEGEVLILALRHNKGLLLYDFNTLELLKKINAKGETLTAYNNAIFATDDKHLYKYDIVNKDADQYEAFLKRIKPGRIVLDNRAYTQLIRRLREYPEIIKKSGISERILRSHDLVVRHSFKYGKIGERIILNGKTPDDEGYREDVYGYKVFYEVRNHSPNYYFVRLASSWSGEYGRPSSYSNGSWDVEESSRRGYAEHAFFILPHDGKYKDHFQVGEREPVNLLIYPERIEKVSENYHKGLMKALSAENNDVSLIDRYLGDNLAKNWHDQLKERKKKLAGQDKNILDILNIFD